MAKIKPTSPARRQAFRQKLNPAQQTTFDQLCYHLDHPRTDLDWYHRLGMLLLRLVPESESGRRIRWLQDNADYLGAGESLLQKACRFYLKYPGQQDVQRLQRLGTDWTSLYLAFAVKDKQARYRLLAESLRKGWTAAALRFEVQRRYPNKRHGIGGRPVAKQRSHGPEVTLREMGRVTDRWIAFHDEAWSNIRPAGWKRLVRTWRPDDRDTLRDFLGDLDRHLKDLMSKAQKVRRRVAALRNRVGKA